MVSKNNVQLKDRYATKQVPHYGIRKLSVGVASVLLSTTLYMGVTAHADTIAETGSQTPVDQPTNMKSGTSTSNVTVDAQLTADHSASTATNIPASGTNTSSKPVQTVSPEQLADTTDVQPASDQLESAAANSNAPENDGSAASAPTVLPKQPVNVADTQPAAAVGAQPFMNLAVASDNNELAPRRETVDSTWTVHYVNQADHKQELKDPTVITMQYTRTNTPQSDGTTQYGDWSYVPDSFKQTGTPITIKDSDNPVKQDNIDKNGENMDTFTITAMYPTVAGYEFHDGVNGTRLRDNLRNNERQADTMSKDFYAEYDVAKERSVTVKFVDDQSYDSDTSDHKKQVGQAITLTGRDGDTVDLKLTVPDKYQLADGQQLPTTYTFTKNSGDLTIHLVHKVVQREATIDVQLGLMTEVHFGNNGYDDLAIPQTRWEQLDDELKDGLGGPGGIYNAMPLIEAGTLTGHVNYDLVDNEVLSFGNDWTSLNLDGHTYQLPNGDDVVNGITFDPETASGKKLKEEILKTYQVTHTDVDSDYVNRPWHGYLSVNATNNSDTYIHQLGLQAGLVGNEPNALAKATDDRAATSVEMSNKPIDLNFVQNYDVEFSEQDGQLRAKVGLPVGGVYVPYVEKTAATRTINVTTPDGKTTAVKQTATLTKQIDLGKDAHQDWTTGEWENYEVPVIPGYTASQFNVAQQAVTDTTKDQTVNITYTANEHQISIEYVDNATGKILKTDHVSGKTGQTVSITPTIPDGWELVSGQSLPSEVTLGVDGAPATVIKVQPQERSVAVKFVDDQLYDQPYKQQVVKVINVTGRDGGTVDLNLTVPDKYQLAKGQQLPTTYTFTKGSGDLTIHLVHQVVQREATVDVQLELMTIVHSDVEDDYDGDFSFVVAQNQWTQLDDEIKDSRNPNSDKVFKLVKLGTLTGHVNYDLVNNKVVSFNDDWTSLNLGGQTYQMPDGTEVVNGVLIGSVGLWGKSFKEQLLKYYPNTDPDYVNRTWYGYLSANKTNEIVASDFMSDYLQTGLAGNEPNALAKAIGDHAVTAVTTAKKTIDLNSLQNYNLEFSEQNGQLRGDGFVPVVGVYIPYVEKTATRTINITAPDGKITAVKQTATIAKQVDFGKDAHPAWTTGEWTSYDVPTIPGYTASQPNVAQQTVTGDTKDQTVDITYIANEHQINVEYVDNATGQVIKTDHVSGKTGQTVPIAPHVPDGWELVSGQEVPSEVTLGADGAPTTVIKVQPQERSVAVKFVDDQSDERQVGQAVTVTGRDGDTVDLKLTVPDKYQLSDGQQLPTSYTFTKGSGDVMIHLKHVIATDTMNVKVGADIVQGLYYPWVNNDDGEGYLPFIGHTSYGDLHAVDSSDDWGEIVFNVGTYRFSYEYDSVTKQLINWIDQPKITISNQTFKVPTNDVLLNGSVRINYDTQSVREFLNKHASVDDGAEWSLEPAVVDLTDTMLPPVVGEERDKFPPYVLTRDDNGNIEVSLRSGEVQLDKDYLWSHLLSDTVTIPIPLMITYTPVRAKSVQRTINVTKPNGKTETIKQNVELTAQPEMDPTLHDGYLGDKAYNVVFNNWSTGTWKAYVPTNVAGYTPSVPQVDKTTVTSDTKDQTVNITYTANPQTTTVVYQTEDGTSVHTTTVNGKTGQTVKVPSEVPAGWTIVKGQVPSELTFGADGHKPIEVTVAHQHVTVTPDHPQNNGTKLPDNPAKTFNGVEANDLNRTVTRTIKVTTPDGQTKTVAQTAKLTRTADVDEATGEVTYGDWTTGEWAAYDVPSVPGYVPSQAKVDQETVTAASKDTTTVITYLPTQHQISVEYVDDDDHGKVVKTDQVPGKTDQTITVTPSAPTNYDLVDSNNRTYTVTSADGQRVQIHVKHHQVKTNESKTVIRTISVHTPHDGVKTVKQTATLNRDVTTDQVTGEKTYGNWTTGQWDAYTPEAISGYTPSINEVPNANVDGSSSDQTVDVAYTADAQKVEIVYVDDAKGGAVVKTDQVAGQTDETVKVTPDVPAGYKVVGKVSGSYMLTSDGHQTITVHLGHQTKTISEDKTVTRTINVHTPHDGVKTIKQTAKLTRNVTTDQVTGEKTYSDWSATLWDRYAVPSVAGYVPSIKQVVQQVVNGTTTDQTVDVTYSSGEHTTHVNYVDGDGNTVHTTTIKGQTDGTAQVPNETPAGWTVVGESVPTELAFGPDGHADVTVTISHKHVTVSPDQPKTSVDNLPDNPAKTYPSGVGHDDLNKTITRTIKITTPGGQTKTVEQTAKLTRTADVDEVTGEVTYGGWTTGEWSNYDVPAVPGYTPSQSEVPATKVTDDTKDQTVTISYTANDQTTIIDYVDQNGKTVHTTVVNGHTDQTVKVPNETPAGWTITNGQVPTEITFGPDGHDRVTVTVGHQHVTVTSDKPQTDGIKLPDNPSQTFHGVAETDLNKTITRTIKVTTPAGKTDTIKQTAKLTRTADVDEVTGEVIYGKWTTGAWSSYSAPTVPGYTPSQAVVAEAAVYADMTDQTVKITYTADSHTTHINYVDENGNVVHTTTVTGQTYQTVKVPNETPAGWMITTGQVPSEVTFGADGHTDVTVSIDHQTVTVTPDHPQADGTKLPDNPTLTFHGVDRDDLNKTVTRIIKLNVPGQAPQVITQTARLTRTATVDEVTGEVIYGDWTSGQWDAYEVPAVDGYTVSQTTIPAVKVTSETTSQDIVIDYVAVPTAQTTPSNNQTDENQVTPEKVANGIVQETKQNTVNNPAQSTMQDTKQLPQTGNDKQAGLLSLIGSSLMASLAVFGLGKKKKHEN